MLGHGQDSSLGRAKFIAAAIDYWDGTLKL